MDEARRSHLECGNCGWRGWMNWAPDDAGMLIFKCPGCPNLYRKARGGQYIFRDPIRERELEADLDNLEGLDPEEPVDPQELSESLRDLGLFETATAQDVRRVAERALERERAHPHPRLATAAAVAAIFAATGICASAVANWWPEKPVRTRAEQCAEAVEAVCASDYPDHLVQMREMECGDNMRQRLVLRCIGGGPGQ